MDEGSDRGTAQGDQTEALPAGGDAGVRAWICRVPLSLRHIEERMAERGVSADPIAGRSRFRRCSERGRHKLSYRLDAMTSCERSLPRDTASAFPTVPHIGSRIDPCRVNRQLAEDGARFIADKRHAVRDGTAGGLRAPVAGTIPNLVRDREFSN